MARKRSNNWSLRSSDKGCTPNAVVVGNPARVIKWRDELGV